MFKNNVKSLKENSWLQKIFRLKKTFSSLKIRSENDTQDKKYESFILKLKSA